jgi:hypothetical protein
VRRCTEMWKAGVAIVAVVVMLVIMITLILVLMIPRPGGPVAPTFMLRQLPCPEHSLPFSDCSQTCRPQL